MTKKKRKTAKSRKIAADNNSTAIPGDTKMETSKSSEPGQDPAKPKSNSAKAAGHKSGRLTVTDLRSDSFVMTRKKSGKTAASGAKKAEQDVQSPVKSSVKAAGSRGSGQKAEKKTASKAAMPEKAGPKKQYVKAGKSCKVTFRLPKEAAPGAHMVTVVGDFNNWNVSETKMKKLKNGDFTTTLELPCNREYRFRYLIDSNRWENDWSADKYLPNRFGSDDSVVVIEGNGSS